MKEESTRRGFLASAGKAALGAGLLASALPAPAIGRPLRAPNDRINLALIGCGGQWQVFPEGDRLKDRPANVDLKGKHHAANFLECIRTRAKPRSDIESMHDTTTTCHLTNLAHLAGRSIKWDPAKEVVIGDPEAMKIGSYQREYRSPWKLPRYEA